MNIDLGAVAALTAAQQLTDADLLAIRDQISEALPTAPEELRAGYEGALRAVHAELGRRYGRETTDLEPLTVELTSVDPVRAEALRAAALIATRSPGAWGAGIAPANSVIAHAREFEAYLRGDQ